MMRQEILCAKQGVVFIHVIRERDVDIIIIFILRLDHDIERARGG